MKNRISGKVPSGRRGMGRSLGLLALALSPLLARPAIAIDEPVQIFWGNNRWNTSTRATSPSNVGAGNTDLAANSKAVYAVNSGTRQLTVATHAGVVLQRLTASGNEIPRAVAVNENWLIYVVDEGNFGTTTKRINAMPLGPDGKPDITDVHLVHQDTASPMSITQVGINLSAPFAVDVGGQDWDANVVFFNKITNPFDPPSNRAHSIDMVLFGRPSNSAARPAGFSHATVIGYTPGTASIHDLAVTGFTLVYSFSHTGSPDAIAGSSFVNKRSLGDFGNWTLDNIVEVTSHYLSATPLSLFYDSPAGLFLKTGPADPFRIRASLGLDFAAALFSNSAPRVIVRGPRVGTRIRGRKFSMVGFVADDKLPPKSVRYHVRGRGIRARWRNCSFDSVGRTGVWAFTRTFTKGELKRLRRATFRIEARDSDQVRGTAVRTYRRP